MKKILLILIGILITSLSFNIIQFNKVKHIDPYIKNIHTSKIEYIQDSKKADSLTLVIDSIQKINTPVKYRVKTYYDTLSYFKVIHDTINIIITQDSIITDQGKIINNQDLQISTFEKVDSLRIKSIKTCDSLNNELIIINENNYKKNKKWKRIAFIAGGVAILEGFVLFIKK